MATSEMMFHVKSAVFLLLYICNLVDNASIFAVFSSLSFADHSVYRGYISLLAQAGHSIVVMTPYPGHFDHTEMDGIVELGVGQESSVYWNEYKQLMTDTSDYHWRMKALNELSVKLAVVQLTSKVMSSLLINPNVKFDLVITEAEMPIFYAIAEKYQAPHITITTSSGLIHQYESKGVPTHPIFYPDVNALSYRNASQWQVVAEINRYIETRNEYYNNYLPLCEIAAKKIFKLKRSLQELEYDIDMLFIASNPLLIGTRPSVPAVAYVDRMQIQPGYQLPEHLEILLDAASKGAIYVSFGAIQEPEHLSVHILQTLADAFSELPYLVLWKIGNTTMINKSDNLITNEWFPQQEVLEHPNVKAFITHGGARSLEEAVFYEVPIVGIPIAASRKVFIKEVTDRGAGQLLDLYSLEKEKLKEVINDVASKERYKDSITQLKNKIVDPLISGPEKAVGWTEYVLRNRGARHLRSPAVGTTFTKYYSLDIISVLLTLATILVLGILLILLYIIRCIRARIWEKYDWSGKFKAL